MFHNIPQPILTFHNPFTILSQSFHTPFTISTRKRALDTFRILQDPSGSRRNSESVPVLTCSCCPQVGPPALMCSKLMKPWIVEVVSKSCSANLKFRSRLFCFMFFDLLYFRFRLFDLLNPFHTCLILFGSLLFSSYMFLLVSRLHRLLASWLAAR